MGDRYIGSRYSIAIFLTFIITFVKNLRHPMSILMKSIILFLALFALSFVSQSQDSLILVTGKRIAYSKIDFEADHIKIKAIEEDEKLIFPPDSIMGFCSPINETNYYLKPYEESNNGWSYQFLERLEVGRINLFEKSASEGQPEFTYGAIFLYMEKDGRFECVFATNATGDKKDEKFEAFTSFVNDDEESLDYIRDASFKFKIDEIIKVVQYYNRRNFIHNDPATGDVHGKVIFYRTKFQKPKSGITLELYGERHKLYINDFIQLNIPIEYATKFTIHGDYLNNDELLAAEFNDQFFEVVLDKKTNTFHFEKKEGSEAQYEFYKIKRKVVRNK